MFNKKILLASQSPRRNELLRMAGFNFRAVTADVDETYSGDIPPEEFPEHLAQKKADAVKSQAQSDEVILAADTIVLKDGIIYGKPADRNDAIQILKELSGVRHEVITGVCLMSPGKQVAFSVVTSVYFKPLSEEQIVYYVDRFKPFDKAGAYAIQEWIGLIGISKIEGCYFNVMGLPVSRVAEELERF
ncbi:MAG TPA: Maf family protein [Chitinophagales bacterium]|nr:Maf family protein [Chitinophagales bacterium]